MLAERENERSLYNTENEPTLFKPREERWREMAEECVDCGVGVTLVMAPSRWADLGTLGVSKISSTPVHTKYSSVFQLGIVPKLTGGDMYFHPKFDPQRDQAILGSQLKRLVNRETGYQATLRLRCTTGEGWVMSIVDVIAEHHSPSIRRLARERPLWQPLGTIFHRYPVWHYRCGQVGIRLTGLHVCAR